MEALTAASVAALTIVDMVKGMDKATAIENVRLIAKTGGKSATGCGSPDAAGPLLAAAAEFAGRDEEARTETDLDGLRAALTREYPALGRILPAAPCSSTDAAPTARRRSAPTPSSTCCRRSPAAELSRRSLPRRGPSAVS
jgi:hypothetical protein